MNMPEIRVSGIELRDVIEDAMKVRDERVNGQFNVINTKLDGITQRLDKVNGTIAKHDQIINDRAIVVADYLEHARDQEINTEKFKTRLRALEDTQLSQKSIKKWIVGTIAITGVVIGIVVGLIDLLSKS
jgi:hypothetical protein